MATLDDLLTFFRRKGDIPDDITQILRGLKEADRKKIPVVELTDPETKIRAYFVLDSDARRIQRAARDANSPDARVLDMISRRKVRNE